MTLCKLLTVDWQALATLLTGASAVAAAAWVANKQNELRRNEARIALLRERRDVIESFRALSSEWQVGARISQESVSKLWALVQDIEILFDQKVHNEANDLFKNTSLQNMFGRHAEMYSRSGEEAKRMASIDKEAEKIDAISTKLPELMRLLVEATQVGTIFR